MITERTLIGKLEILEDGQLQIRTDRIVEADGVELARLFHRRVLEPDMVTTGETDLRLKAVITTVWTPEVIAAYEEKKRNRPRLPAEGVSSEDPR